MSYINEHLPTVIASSLEMFTYTAIIVAILGFMNSKFKLYEAFLILGLYLMALSGRRNIYLLIGLTAGIVAKMIDEFIKANNKTENKIRQKVFFVIISVIAIIGSMWMFIQKQDTVFVNEKEYPIEASQYIKENLDYKNIRLYNQYDYGSYLLMEGILVFIDSRCDLYTPEFNKGVIVFDDYMNIQYGKKTISKLMNKYNLEYALVPIKSFENTYMKEDSRFTEIYKDKNFIIYEYNK